jgi:4-hydroxybenzoate polyprenyltransferase
MQVSADSPLAARLLAWANERFPPVTNAVLCAFLYGASLSCGRAATWPGALPISILDGAGFLAVFASLLMLRVYDEHKDYALDLQNHPQRVLQRGLITLTHLKVLGALAIAVQLGASLLFDREGGRGIGAVTTRWLLVFVWSALMAKEFFIGTWLARRLVLYAVSHMLVLPMAVLWMVQMGAGQTPLPSSAYLLALIALLSGFSFEIGRKTRAPADERPTVDSYTKVLGVRGAVVTLLALGSALGAALCFMVQRIAGSDLSVGGLALAVLTAALPVTALLTFLRAPSTRGAKLIEAAIALQTLLAYGLVVGLWLVRRGAAWL